MDVITISTSKSTTRSEKQQEPPLIELIELEKQYMMGKVPVDALCGINLSVNRGDFIAILGPSGSGKSTMMNLIGGLDKPSKGTVRIDGIDLSEMNETELAEVRQRIGFVCVDSIAIG